MQDHTADTSKHDTIQQAKAAFSSLRTALEGFNQAIQRGDVDNLAAYDDAIDGGAENFLAQVEVLRNSSKDGFTENMADFDTRIKQLEYSAIGIFVLVLLSQLVVAGKIIQSIVGRLKNNLFAI